MTGVAERGYLAYIANHEAQVERKRTNNPIITMTGFVAPDSTQGAGEFLVDLASRRLH